MYPRRVSDYSISTVYTVQYSAQCTQCAGHFALAGEDDRTDAVEPNTALERKQHRATCAGSKARAQL